MNFLVVLQTTVSTAIREWLDTNKGEVVRAMQEGVRQSEAAKHERQQTKLTEFLTVADRLSAGSFTRRAWAE